MCIESVELSSLFLNVVALPSFEPMSARQAKMPPTPCPVIKAWVYLGGIIPAKPNNPP